MGSIIEHIGVDIVYIFSSKDVTFLLYVLRNLKEQQSNLVFFCQIRQNRFFQRSKLVMNLNGACQNADWLVPISMFYSTALKYPQNMVAVG